ncbi:hypothetical protein, partial [Aphanothece microscopica]|uniref:hypothetical protein n=1 Tax=Aphanothece microscopica TaxID=1049561 RepID=UPI00398489A9
PPARQAEELARLRETPTGNPADVGRVNRLAGIAENTRKSLDRDRLAHVRDRGILPVEPVDVADPQSVQRRIAVAETVHREFTPEAREILYFDRGEADALRAELEGTDPDRALAVVNTIARTFGDRAPAALAQLGATDPTLHLAAVLPTETGDIAAARAVFEGRILHRKNEGAAVAAE